LKERDKKHEKYFTKAGPCRGSKKKGIIRRRSIRGSTAKNGHLKKTNLNRVSRRTAGSTNS